MAGNFLLEINPGMAIIGELPNGQLGEAYSYQLKGVGGQGGYTFSTTGLTGTEFSLASDGTITSAGPTVPANIDFAVTMRDVLGRKVVREFTLRVIALPLSVAGSLGVFTYGASYNDTLTVSGGVAPYTVTPLTKPSWLGVSILGDTITLSAASAGSYSGSEVKLRVTDNVGAHIDVSYPFAWTTLTLTGTFADGAIGTAYTSSLTISGGNGVYSLTGGDGVTVGSLPPGLSLSISGNSLTLSGTFPSTGGPWSFTAGVDSGDGQSATSVQSVDIIQSPKILIIGSYGGSYVFNTADNSVSSTSNAPSKDTRGTAVMTDSGRVYRNTSDGKIYELDTNTLVWSLKSATSGLQATCVAIGGENILFIWNDSPDTSFKWSTYDATNDSMGATNTHTISGGADMKSGMYDATVLQVVGNKAYFSAGVDDMRFGPWFELDFVNNTVLEHSAGTYVSRYRCHCQNLYNNKLYYFDFDGIAYYDLSNNTSNKGSNVSPLSIRSGTKYTAMVGDKLYSPKAVYDISADTFTSLSGTPSSSTTDNSTVSDSDGNVYAVESTGDGVYKLSGTSWSKVATLPSAVSSPIVIVI